MFSYKILVARFEVQPDSSVELSPLGLRFLKEIFKKYDKVSFYMYFLLHCFSRGKLGWRWCTVVC